MYELKVLSSFSSAHALRGYNGKCENIHGHNWQVETMVASNVLNEIGLVIDFKLLKKYIGGIMEMLDHKFLNELDFFREVNPSAENIARYIYEELEKIIGLNEYNECKDIRITRVNVYETSSSMASYYKN
ncbi:MAG: 6-carboxytetrahydropterin synthase QueD [Deltaproteobacteria bacterium]|jgi:6-pyruvoyltetrahydropterin/6-carboxytetrahydropterin synthase|nr:6-carboxytetrahydropterin synthase QueD [Deltaproteobacteria bacterium]MCL5879378.1 6-carboxytetrahydropterin synthase QueD [Deltaproteobacteria bacterium]MDA8304537.1 6-carboxytetrahydropterin synthase QueD [Deltaproteobacteria bacterium]